MYIYIYIFITCMLIKPTRKRYGKGANTNCITGLKIRLNGNPFHMEIEGLPKTGCLFNERRK